MRSTASRLLALLAVTCAAATLASAGDSCDLGRRDLWRPGDVVTTALREEDSQEFRFPAAAGAESKPRRLKTTATQVERCLETDLDGNRTSTMVWFAAWSVDNGTTKDESLKGAFVLVTGRGKDRAFRLLSSPTPPTKPARAWLERQFGAGRPDAVAVRGVWLPKVPVVVGETWSADLETYLAGSPMAANVDRAHMTSNCRLAAHEGDVATVACEATVPLSTFPAAKGGAPLPWKSGGVQSVKGTIVLGFDDRIATSKASWTRTLEGAVEAEGRAVEVRLRFERTLEIKRGGEMPAEPSAPGAAAPPAPGGAPPATPPVVPPPPKDTPPAR